MHSYLRAIGFSKINDKKELRNIIKMVYNDSDESDMAEIREGILFTQIRKNFAPNMGIEVCGEYNSENEYSMEYYYPYFNGSGMTNVEYVQVEKHTQKEAYAVICEDINIEISIIVYLKNVCEYINQGIVGSWYREDVTITLSGLSLEGKILLPINKSEKQKEYTKKALTNRNHLIAKARQGDEDAIESLTLDDMDTYTRLSRRIMKEDIFSIVDTYFMPYGIECDQYSILGEILECEQVENIITKEKIYIIKLNCNNIIFDICINKEDIIGEPMVGRRFKGNIWLQGRINYESKVNSTSH